MEKPQGHSYAFKVIVGYNATGKPEDERFKVRQAVYEALLEKMPVEMMPEFLGVVSKAKGD